MQALASEVSPLLNRPGFMRAPRRRLIRSTLFAVLFPWVIGAHMRRKLLIAIRLEVAHHFIERSPARSFRWLESPSAIGAAEAPKTRSLNPCQLPDHGRASYRTRISIVCRASYVFKQNSCAFRSRNPYPGQFDASLQPIKAATDQALVLRSRASR
jgi:hypothetical protein